MGPHWNPVSPNESTVPLFPEQSWRKEKETAIHCSRRASWRDTRGPAAQLTRYCSGTPCNESHACYLLVPFLPWRAAPPRFTLSSQFFHPFSFHSYFPSFLPSRRRLVWRLPASFPLSSWRACPAPIAPRRRCAPSVLVVLHLRRFRSSSRFVQAVVLPRANGAGRVLLPVCWPYSFAFSENGQSCGPPWDRKQVGDASNQDVRQTWRAARNTYVAGRMDVTSGMRPIFGGYPFQGWYRCASPSEVFLCIDPLHFLSASRLHYSNRRLSLKR